MSDGEVPCRVCGLRFVPGHVGAEAVCPACAPTIAKLRAGGVPIVLEVAPDPRAADAEGGDVLVLTEATIGPEVPPTPAFTLPPRAGSGVVFRFACPVCDVLLEAAGDDGGRPTTCPTCGQNFPIPQYDRRSGRVFFDPARTPQRPQESLAYLHAYACAGRNAPTVVRTAAGEPAIRCARCSTLNPADSNWCRSCRMPFAVENQRSTGSDKASGQAKAGLITALGAVPLAFWLAPLAMVGAVVAFALSLGAVLSLRRADERTRGMFLAGCGAALSAVTFFVAMFNQWVTKRW